MVKCKIMVPEFFTKGQIQSLDASLKKGYVFIDQGCADIPTDIVNAVISMYRDRLFTEVKRVAELHNARIEVGRNYVILESSQIAVIRRCVRELRKVVPVTADRIQTRTHSDVLVGPL